MAAVLIGTDEGVLRLESGGAGVRQEGGSPPAALLTSAGDHVYAVRREGALWERRAEGAWRQVSARMVEDEVWSFAADPRVPGRLYLGVSPALLYRSDDGGRSWTACESIRRIPGYETWTFPPPPHIPHVRSIAIDPAAPGAVYIGVEEVGIYRSPDGGETWEGLNDGLYWDVHTVTPAPEGARLYATTGAGFHRSDDGGRRWQPIKDGLDRSYTVPFTMSPANPQRVFTAAASAPPPAWRRAGADAAIYRSDAGGAHWTQLRRGLPDRFDTMVARLVLDGAGGVYAASGSALYASDDEGDSWRLLADDLPPVRTLATVS